MRSAVAVATLLGIGATTPGCIMFGTYAIAASHTPTRNVTDKPDYWGGYIVDAEYELLEDVFIGDSAYSRGKGLAPTAGFAGTKRVDGYWGQDTSADTYRANSELWPYILGVLERGTRLRCSLIRYNRGLVVDVESYQIFGVVTTGPWTGTRVDLREVSLKYSNAEDDWREAPNPDLLKRVQEPAAIEG